MLHPGPAAARTLTATALTAIAGAWMLTALDLVGGAPLVLAAAAAAVPLAIAMAALRPQRAGRGLALAQALLPAVLGMAHTLAGWVGPLAPSGRAWTGLLLAMATGATLPAALAARRCWARARPAPVGEALGAAAGVALSALAPPWLAGSLAALALAATLGGAAPARAGVPDGAGPLRAAPLLVGAFALLLGWTWVRPLADPSAGGALVVMAVAVASAVLTRGLGPSRASAALVLAALSVTATWLLAWKGPGLARLVVLAGAGDGALLPAPLLWSLPLAALAALSGALLGLAWGPRPVSSTAWAGLPLAAAPLLLDDPWAPLWLAGLVGASAPLWTLYRPAQAGGVATAAACLALAWSGGRPDPLVLAAGAWPLLRTQDSAAADAASRASLVAVQAEIGPGGAVLLQVPADRWDVDRNQPEPGVRVPRLLELDGLMAESRGRAAEAETLAGHLVGLLAPERGRLLVLGDDLARALGGVVQHPFSAITVGTPSPGAVRAMATVDPQLRALWLDPRVHLAAGPPGAVLATSPRPDAVIEVVRAPWADADHLAPTRAHLAAVHARLPADGLYVLVLHLGWMESGAPAAIGAQLAREFGHVQAWLPPFGADTLILVAGAQAPPLSRLVERLAATPALLGELDATVPEDLASLAVADGAGLVAWRQALDGHLPSPARLGRALLARPVLHLATLADHMAAPESTWQVEDEAARARLAIRRQARESFLRLLGEATSGDMEAVFRRARELQQQGGSLGAAALEPLIEPHVQDARRALDRARAEGLVSPAWDDAMRFATTARMLAPTSPRPLVLLGEIALGRGKVTTADETFGQALELEPDHVPALTGRARAARARGDRTRAEALLRQATEAAPRDWRAAQNLGVYLMQEGRLVEAEEVLRRAVMLTDGGQAAPQLALAELMLQDGRPGAALLTAEDALKQEETGYGWYLRGRAHYDLGERERAEEDFRRAVILSPDLVEARGGIGLILAERGELEQAAEAFRAVLRLAPDNRAARETLRRIEEDIAASEPAPR